MKTLKSIDPMQLGKVYAVIYFIIAAVILIPMGLIMMATGASNLGGDEGLGFLGGGVFMFIAPFLYAVVAFLMGMLSAWIYNITYKYHGGIKVTVE